MMRSGREDDPVVDELDVYFCSKDELGAQLYVLQHPLRPGWTPYDTENSTDIRFKPESRKLEVEVTLDGVEHGFDDETEKKPSGGTLKLNATDVDARTTFYTIGYKRGRALYLTEVEGVFQLKPSLDHLDPVEPEKTEEKPKEELTQLQAKMRRRETAAEQQRRENSYAHLAKKERLEKWKPLQAINSASRITEKVLDQLTTPVEAQPEATIHREAFLTRFAPKRAKSNALPKPALPEIKPSPPRQLEINEALLSELSTVLDALLASSGVANLKDVRNVLRTRPSDGTGLRELAFVEDVVLHDALMRSKNITCLRRVYLRSATGSVQLDALRTILMGIVREKETIRRNDVISAAKAKGVKITEKLFDAIMREICVSKEGGFWTLKTGKTP